MKAILVVDVQNDFVSGSLAVPGAYDTVALINRYLERHLVNSSEPCFIVASRDEHIEPGDHFDPEKGGYPVHCVKGTTGADFAIGFHADLVDVVVRKGAHAADPSPFDGRADDERSLEQILKDAQVTELEVCGIATDVCVRAGVLDAIHLGFQPILLVSLTAAIGGNEGMTDAVAEMINAGAWVK